jgi:hypothetical protein
MRYIIVGIDADGLSVAFGTVAGGSFKRESTAKQTAEMLSAAGTLRAWSVVPLKAS